MSGSEIQAASRNFKWERLLRRISQGKVTPFLGAGACAGILPLGADVARGWASEYGYPFKNSDDLVSVAQYLAVTEDPATPKELIADLLSKIQLPAEGDDIHSTLAELPLPVYITTNYDHLMVEALRRVKRPPRQEYCRWNSALKDGASQGRDKTDTSSIFEQDNCRVDDSGSPVVFHLHGHLGNVDSLVISEDDYLEFLVQMQVERGKNGIVPLPIQRRLTDSLLLFIGYRIADWNFRVLFHALQSQGYDKYEHVSVQLEPTGLSEQQQRNAQEYFEKHFDRKDIQVYWGDAKDFMRELREQWRRYRAKAQPVS